MDVTQGKLGMGFTCGSDDTAALLMGNTLFGGSSNSKLFLNVREKLSLCYFASSLYHRQKGIITVSSGIEFENYQKAYDEIMRQLEAVQKGELEDWELESARSVLLNAYASMGDSQGKLENFYIGQAATGQEETPELLARILTDPDGQCRGVQDGWQFSVLLNQADTPERIRLGLDTARAIRRRRPGCRVVLARLLPVPGCWKIAEERQTAAEEKV